MELLATYHSIQSDEKDAFMRETNNAVVDDGTAEEGKEEVAMVSDQGEADSD